MSVGKGSDSLVSGNRVIKLSVLTYKGKKKYKQSILYLVYDSSE